MEELQPAGREQCPQHQVAEPLQHLPDVLLRDSLQPGADDAEGVQVELDRNRREFAEYTAQAKGQLECGLGELEVEYELECAGAGGR